MKKLVRVEILWQETREIHNDGKVAINIYPVKYFYDLQNRKRWMDARWKQRVSYEFEKENGHKPSFEDVEVTRYYE